MSIPQIIASLLMALGLHCGPGVTRLDGVQAPLPYLAPAAAESFQHIRAHVEEATGIDALATLGDALRWPTYTTTKPGVAFRSWHKAGLAVDLNGSLNWKVIPDGRYHRLFLRGVDVTQIFLDHGWRRIPAVDGVPEWWHFQFTTPDMDWDAAVAQAWPEGNTLIHAACVPVTPASPPASEVSPDQGGTNAFERPIRAGTLGFYRMTRAE